MRFRKKIKHCQTKGRPFCLFSVSIIEIRKDFLLGDFPELQIEILDTINLEAKGNPAITTVQDIAFSQHFFLLLDRVQGLLKFDNTLQLGISQVVMSDKKRLFVLYMTIVPIL